MMTRRELIYISFVSALIGGAILLRYMDPFFVRALRLIAFDNFQRLDPEPYDPNLPIRIVDIDEKSLSDDRSMAMAANNGARSIVGIDVQGGRGRRVRRFICRTRPHFARGHHKTAARQPRQLP